MTPLVDAGGRSREPAMLLQCARRQMTERAIGRARELAKAPFDWNYLVALAEAHGVWPLLVTHLKSAAVDVPTPIIQHLEQRLFDTTALNIKLTMQLAAVLHRLHTHGVPALAFKGPALAAAYGHVGLRSFTDLDLLVPREAIRAVRDEMLANGYTLSYLDHNVLDGVYPPAGREYVFYPKESGLAMVEVHAAVSTWAMAVRLGTSGLLDRAVPVSVAGAPIRTMCPEDNLLMLALHGTFHFWCSLNYVSDIDAAAHAPLDWDTVFERARSARMARMLAVALLLARELLETEFPEVAMRVARRDRAAVRLTSQVTRRLFDPIRPRFEHVWRDWVRVQSRECVSDKLRYSVRTIAYERFIRQWDRWTQRTD